ncbi:uncharacterized protein LOC111718055 [Eurytemora carolleeae]|uniref:uncharacterized protein LOC111718055 n=1 Tax=Eurytemora carolleeae TaxID=1294199 RepID=UPI000C76ED21|nr:uncharacterized protein LOC111718055 [Eurytemora carolleeae]|eukprot:XP_023349312.1 uncharacterized protein LOC111718055 [Eurytemora affinis]
MSTVVAMVASFLGSQHTFCFLQEVEEEGLNLKTPGPKPHPSWVYRYNIEDKTQVKRSSSLLQQTRSSSVLGLSSALGSGSALLAPGVGRGGVGGGVGGVHGFQRMDLLNPLPKAPRDLSPPGLHLGSIPDQPELKTIKHAVIRRHNSMYAASSRTPGPNPFQPPYTFKDVTGASEIRPIVTLQRSKTVTPGAILYRSSSIQAVARSYSTAPQFRQYVARYRQADIPLHGTTGRYRKHSKARLYPDQDSGNQFCEFQKDKDILIFPA